MALFFFFVLTQTAEKGGGDSAEKQHGETN